MAPFFDGIKSFADVPTEPGIDTVQFLEAAEGLVKLFDVLGNSAFKVVQSDLTGNIEVRERAPRCVDVCRPTGNRASAGCASRGACSGRTRSQLAQKIRTRYNAAPEQSKTLESLIEFEAKEAAGDKKKRKARAPAQTPLTGQAAEALLWLTRGLSFTAQALRRNVDNPSEELSVSFVRRAPHAMNAERTDQRLREHPQQVPWLRRPRDFRCGDEGLPV